MRLKNEADRSQRQFVEVMRKLGWSEHTVRAYERGLQFFLRWLVKETDVESLNAVTSETIAAWREELAGWNVAPSTRDLRFAAVKTFFRLMNEAGAIDSDVAAGVAFPKRDEHSRRRAARAHSRPSGECNRVNRHKLTDRSPRPGHP